MMNSKKRSDEEIVAAFEKLFDESLIPASLEEADESIKKAGIDPDNFRAEMHRLTTRLLAESPYNWRNQKDDEIESNRASLERIKIPSGLTKKQLWDRITSLQAKYPEVFPQPLQFAFRNAKEQSEDDIAYLLQEMIHRVQQAGIEIDEDE